MWTGFNWVRWTQVERSCEHLIHRVPWQTGNFLTSWWTVRLSGNTVCACVVTRV